jgi:hypothetical protein
MNDVLSMLYNPEALSAEVLAGDIKRYLKQGVALAAIYNGAVSNGIPETLWREAVIILEIKEKDLERFHKKQKNRTQKIVLFFGAMIFVGLFFTFLIYQNMETLQSLNFIDRTATTTLVDEPVIPKTEVPIETVVPKRTTSADALFNSAVADGSIVVDYFGVDDTYTIFSSVTTAQVFLEDLIGTYFIESVKISFDQNSQPILNDFQLQAEDARSYFMLTNTITPFQSQDLTLVFHEPDSLLATTIPNYDTAAWEVFLEKIEFKNQSKKNLTFVAELFVHNEKSYFRVTYDYPNTELDSALEVDFIPFTKGNGQQGIAFGRAPKLSTGFLSKKYPMRSRPKPSRFSD